MIDSGSLKDGLYYLHSQPNTQGRLIQAYYTVQADDSAARIWLWHQRLGHPSFLILQHMFPVLFLHNNVSKFQCETCELSKHHHVSFSPSINKSDAHFVLVHTVVWGPSRMVSLSGYQWFVSFIDYFSRTTWVYLLKNKSDVFSVFQIFYKMVHTQFNTTIKILRSDNGGDYMPGNALLTAMLDTHVPKSYWGDALLIATYLINRMPS